MLIDFTVENYRSIKEPVTLSLVAQGGTRKSKGAKRRPRVTPDQEIAASIPVEGRGIELLPAVGIFGANASGKSNVLRALANLLEFIKIGGLGRSDSSISARFPHFKLDQASSGLPTRFELRVALRGVIYAYHLEIDRARVLREKLEMVPPYPKRNQSRLLFDRIWSQDLREFKIINGPDFGDAYREIQESLRGHEPFMAILASKLNVAIVGEPIKWLTASWLDLTPDSQGLDDYVSGALFSLGDDLLQKATSMVRAFDTGISRIRIEEPEDAREDFKVWVSHEVNGLEIPWAIEEESAGTRRLFGLSGKLLASLNSGSLVLVDELSSSIHPNIARAIVRLFQSEKANPRHAQLIFTSHDNTLQRGNLMRRDQIWFTAKREDGSTDLYPLTDFRPRNDLALDKAYLDGRFGAVPIIPSDQDLIAALKTSS
jgi:hypothetical protein